MNRSIESRGNILVRTYFQCMPRDYLRCIYIYGYIIHEGNVIGYVVEILSVISKGKILYICRTLHRQRESDYQSGYMYRDFVDIGVYRWAIRVIKTKTRL